jgi:outer membrane protein, heavy metal efflux system
MRSKRRNRLSLFIMLALFGLSGCAGAYTPDTAWPERRSLGADLKAFVPPPATPGSMSETIDLSDPTGSLTLRQALALALMKNPALAASAWEVRIAEARALQAQLSPNPVIEVGTSSLTQSHTPANNFQAADTVQICQAFELGGKRAKRARVATLDSNLAGWDYETKRLDVFTEVTKSFVEVLAAQEQVALNAEMAHRAKELLVSASGRIKAGKTPAPEIIKAEVELSNIKIQEEQAKGRLQAARRRLAGTWEQKTPTFEKVEGVLTDVSPVPSFEELSEFVSSNPDVARWVKETEQRSAALELEKAKRIPDVTLGGGVQQFRDNNENALIFGVSIPIPLSDRNQGNALAAGYKLQKAKAESREAAIKANSALGDAHQALLSSYKEATGLRDNVLPALERFLDAHYQRFLKDRSALSEVVDVRQTLRDARVRYIEALAAYHKAKADVERLIGERLDR